jgi:DNA-binding HxlR family transcriptional regulator
MGRRRFQDENCSVAQALEIIGDWWTILVVREAFLGARRFADFEANLAISKNVLAQRLAHLVEHGVLERVDAGHHGTRYEYVLTPKGKDLTTVLTALRQWGDRWVFGPGREPLLVVDRRTGRPIPRLRIAGEDGQPVASRDLELRPGPGASKATLKRFRQRT